MTKLYLVPSVRIFNTIKCIEMYFIVTFHYINK